MGIIRRSSQILLLWVVLCLPAVHTDAAEQAGIALQLVAKGFHKPVYLTHAGDGSRRLFVVEQGGRVHLLEGQHRRIFLDIRERVTSGGEKGLLSVAFHPDFGQNGRLFVNYTSGGLLGLRTVVSEFRLSANGMADKASERRILTVKQPYPNHNGGQIAFGPDGYLYIGMGDGGWANDPKSHGQNRSTLLGAMLRIDVDRTSSGKGYAIPADNPLVDKKVARDEIWAWGLRNPWRFSFDAKTGRLFAGDVGQDDREEIDLIEKGKNYGWNIMEGTICTPAVNPECQSKGLTPPLWDYGHDQGCSVTGGYVYRGRAIRGLTGHYLFGDYCSGRIWVLGPGRKSARLLLHTQAHISSFGEDALHELYVVDYGGKIFKIVPADSDSRR